MDANYFFLKKNYLFLDKVTKYRYSIVQSIDDRFMATTLNDAWV